MKRTKESTWEFYNSSFEYQVLLDDFNEGWIGLREFGYDLVANLNPKRIVELGTYKGTSLFSFAQAIKDRKIKAAIFGVDTWKGDIHTGFYSQEVYRLLKKIIQKYYSKVKITLHRMTFDDGLKYFPNGSIDLLHIDGLHTYEAVKHDYETWEDKLSKNGVVLFHDIHYFQRGFGVYKFWGVLKRSHPTLELKHSNGLGILFKNQELYEKFKDYEKFWQVYYPVKATNNDVMNQLEKARSGKLVDQLKKDISKLKADLMRQDGDIDSLQKQLHSVTSAKFFRLWQKYCYVRDNFVRRKKAH